MTAKVKFHGKKPYRTLSLAIIRIDNSPILTVKRRPRANINLRGGCKLTRSSGLCLATMALL